MILFVFIFICCVRNVINAFHITFNCMIMKLKCEYCCQFALKTVWLTDGDEDVVGVSSRFGSVSSLSSSAHVLRHHGYGSASWCSSQPHPAELWDGGDGCRWRRGSGGGGGRVKKLQHSLISQWLLNKTGSYMTFMNIWMLHLIHIQHKSFKPWLCNNLLFDSLLKIYQQVWHFLDKVGWKCQQIIDKVKIINLNVYIFINKTIWPNI